MKLDGKVHNDWLADAKPDEWLPVVVEGPSRPGGDGDHKILIFDSMGGPQNVHIRNYKLEVFAGGESAL